LSRKLLLRVSAAIFSGLALAAIMVAVLLVANAGTVGGKDDASLRWALPVLAGMLVSAVAWALLMESPSDSGQEVSRGSCSTCGRSVLAEWRLCPYCGTLATRRDIASDRHQNDRAVQRES
jgi:hypothetical protein